MFHRIVYLILVGTGLFYSCEKTFEGDRNALSAPETYAVVDSIRRDSGNFLTSTVTGYWWGHSPEGFITGYEISTDNQATWTYTTNQKGSFSLTLPSGVKEGLLPIFIRAIDNRGVKDPTPARMVFPVRNSNPRVILEPLLNKRSFRTFPVVLSVYSAVDIDGLQDIARYDLALNDTASVFALPATFSTKPQNDSTTLISIRIEARIQSGNFISDCDVYTGTRTTPVTGTLTGMVFNDTNTLYIRAVDKTGNTSAWIADSFFVIRPASDVLLVNALSASVNEILNVYRQQLTGPLVGLTAPDEMPAPLSSADPDEFSVTQTRTFNLFKKLTWLTDQPYSLIAMQQYTPEFFTNNGRAFIAVTFPSDFNSPIPFLSFTPIENLVTDTLYGYFKMNINREAKGFNSGWPVLKSEAILDVRPFNTYSSNSGLY